MSLFTLPILKILKDQYAQLPLPSESIVRGGTYIVTGANIGLGYECAKHLVNFSASHVILAVRSQERGDVAKARIESDTGRTGIAEVWLLDLANYDSVKAFAERAMTLARLDGIVENASVALGRWSMSEETETMITVNVLSTFLLAVLLLPKMRESAVTTGTIPHIAVISSGAAFSGAQEVLEKLEGDSIEALSEEGNWGDFSSRYGITKLLQIYATRELASLLPVSEYGVVMNTVSPGLCNTDLDRNAPLMFRLNLWFMRMVMGRTAEMGSRTLLHALFAGKESHGEYLRSCEIKGHLVPKWLTNAEGKNMQQRVWSDIARRLEGISPGCLQKILA